MEILPGRRAPVSLVLDSSATLAWSYSEETTGPIRYDAAYPELAVRGSLPLATLDDELRAAATALGLRLLGGHCPPQRIRGVPPAPFLQSETFRLYSEKGGRDARAPLSRGRSHHATFSYIAGEPPRCYQARLAAQARFRAIYRDLRAQSSAKCRRAMLRRAYDWCVAAADRPHALWLMGL